MKIVVTMRAYCEILEDLGVRISNEKGGGGDDCPGRPLRISERQPCVTCDQCTVNVNVKKGSYSLLCFYLSVKDNIKKNVLTLSPFHDKHVLALRCRVNNIFINSSINNWEL